MFISVYRLQAEHTLGRKFIEGRDGADLRRADANTGTDRQVQRLSAHADGNDLLVYASHSSTDQYHSIVHGEEKQALSLGAAIQAVYPAIGVRIPHQGSAHET